MKVQDLPGVIQVVRCLSAQLSYFGISTAQLWVVEDAGSLWSIRSDGLRITTSETMRFLDSIDLENGVDSLAEIIPSSLAWSKTKEMVISLQLAPEKLWNTWKCFKIVNVPCEHMKAILIFAGFFVFVFYFFEEILM